MNAVLAWLSDLFTARQRLHDVQKLNDALLQAHRAVEQENHQIKEHNGNLQLALADAGEKHRAVMTSLVACVTEKQALRQARDEAQVALASALGQNEALRASGAALQASLSTVQAGEAMWRASVSELQARYAPFILPPAPQAAAWQTRPVGFLRTALDSHIQEMLLPSDQGRIHYQDGEYRLLRMPMLLPFFTHWRERLMLPGKAERSDCENRAVDFAAWYHRWSKGESQVGIVEGTHPWVVVDGQPWPHVFNVAVDPDGTTWLLDPSFLSEPKLWVDEARIHNGFY